jgi:hypothetical protein
MTKKRFEVPLTEHQHAKLEHMSDETGVSQRDLARLAIVRLLGNPDALLGHGPDLAAAKTQT